jgi:hypothetical protein
MNIADKKIFIVTDNNGRKELSYLDLSGQKKVTVLPDAGQSSYYLMNFSSFNGVDYLSLLTDNNQLLLIDHIFSNNPGKSIFSRDATFASFSKDGRFLLINNKHNLKTYDFDRQDRLFNSQNFKQLKDLKWLDNYHILALDGGELKMADFDGQNNQTLSESNNYLPNLMPDLSDKSVYLAQTDSMQSNSSIIEVLLTLKN